MSCGIPNIIGHRGAKGSVLENTLESFEFAMKNGVKWVELDAMLSKDGVPMVFHDETLDRLCDVKGRLDSYACQELRSFKLKGGLKIPTLAEVLELLKKYDGRVNIEIKPSKKELARETAAAVWKIARESGFDTDERLMFSSFEWDALEETYKIAPHIPRGVLVEEDSPDWRPAAKKIKAFSINYDADILTDALIAEIVSSGYRLLVYTVNDPITADRLLSKGVLSVFTDNPLEMNQLEAGHGRAPRRG